MVVFTFSILDRKSLFGQIWSKKSQNCQFKLKCGTHTNLNMWNSMALFIFSVLDRKHPFWANLVQKIKVVSLSWNVVPRLIQICRIHCWCSYFPFYLGNSLFGQNLVQKIKIVSLSRNLVPGLFEYGELNGAVHFFCFRQETPFLGKFGPKIQNCQFKLKFGT